jgi:hypothetical protein
MDLSVNILQKITEHEDMEVEIIESKPQEKYCKNIYIVLQKFLSLK